MVLQTGDLMFMTEHTKTCGIFLEDSSTLTYPKQYFNCALFIVPECVVTKIKNISIDFKQINNTMYIVYIPLQNMIHFKYKTIYLQNDKKKDYTFYTMFFSNLHELIVADENTLSNNDICNIVYKHLNVGFHNMSSKIISADELSYEIIECKNKKSYKDVINQNI